MRIFDARIDNFSRDEIIAAVDHMLDEPRFHQIATINPEFLLLARENEIFKQTLNSCDLNIADGFGLHLAFWRQREKLRGRFPGVDLMQAILARAEEEKSSVFLVARQDGLSTWKATAVAILKLYPTLKISGIFAHTGSKDFSKVYDRAREYDIVFCNFGAPYQEYFLEGLRQNLGRVRLSMGVGGSFDYISGKIRRAPLWMRVVGLEWLWRLIRQPKRWRRIWNAVFVFLWKLLVIRN